MKQTKIKLLTAIIGAMFAVGVYAADNSIFIDQTGSNSIITINQDGAGNKIGGLGSIGPEDTNRANLYGNSQIVNINQVGSGNTLKMDVRTVNSSGNTNSNNTNGNIGVTVSGVDSVRSYGSIDFGNGNGNNFIYSVVGNTNSAVIDSNSAGTAGASDSNNIGINIYGNSNTTKFNTLGTANTTILNIGANNSNSNSNTVNSVINGDNNRQSTNIQGSSNTANLYQGIGSNLDSNTVDPFSGSTVLNGIDSEIGRASCRERV